MRRRSFRSRGSQYVRLQRLKDFRFFPPPQLAKGLPWRLLQLLIGLCGKADAIDSGDDPIRRNLAVIKLELGGTDFHRLQLNAIEAAQRSRNPAYACLAMHSLD